MKSAAIKLQGTLMLLLGCVLMLPAGAADDAGDVALIAKGKKLFLSVTPQCAICHTLMDANAQGQVGPNLDELKPDAQRLAKAIKNGLGNMPAFGERLSPTDIDALARYVVFATTGVK